jgi:hypothetical protein
MIIGIKSDIFLNSIKKLALITKTQRVSCEIGTTFLNDISKKNSCLKPKINLNDILKISVPTSQRKHRVSITG